MGSDGLPEHHLEADVHRLVSTDNNGEERVCVRRCWDAWPSAAEIERSTQSDHSPSGIFGDSLQLRPAISGEYGAASLTSLSAKA